LIIPCEVVKDVFDEMNEETIIKLGKKFGSYIPKHSLFLKGEFPTVDNILLLMKTNCQSSNWYQVNSQDFNGIKKILLRHNLGRKWSIYLSEYYLTLFKQLFDLKIETEIGNDSLVVTIPKHIKINKKTGKINSKNKEIKV
jgi:hypothetical protein